MSPRAIATICCSPPDSVWASWPRRSAMTGNRRSTRASVSSRCGRARGLWAPSSTLSSTVRNGKRRRRSSTCARPSPAVRCAGRPSMRLPLEGDAAGARRDEPGDRVHQRGLAGAVRPEHGDDLALAHVQRRLPQHLEVAVGDVEVLDSAAAPAGSSARSLDVRLAEVGLDDPRGRASPRRAAPSAIFSPR